MPPIVDNTPVSQRLVTSDAFADSKFPRYAVVAASSTTSVVDLLAQLNDKAISTLQTDDFVPVLPGSLLEEMLEEVIIDHREGRTRKLF